MYRYHGSEVHKERLAMGRCRCHSEGKIHDLAALLQKGRITDPHQVGSNLSTPGVRMPCCGFGSSAGGDAEIFIFAVDEELRIHIAQDTDRAVAGAVKHETLFHNADVLAAGEICIRDGIIAGLNDHSGSYGTRGALETDREFADAVLQAFSTNDLPVSEILRDELENLRKV
jgi:hypothetical protein